MSTADASPSSANNCKNRRDGTRGIRVLRQELGCPRRGKRVMRRTHVESRAQSANRKNSGRATFLTRLV